MAKKKTIFDEISESVAETVAGVNRAARAAARRTAKAERARQRRQARVAPSPPPTSAALPSRALGPPPGLELRAPKTPVQRRAQRIEREVKRGLKMDDQQRLAHYGFQGATLLSHIEEDQRRYRRERQRAVKQQRKLEAEAAKPKHKLWSPDPGAVRDLMSWNPATSAKAVGRLAGDLVKHSVGDFLLTGEEGLSYLNDLVFDDDQQQALSALLNDALDISTRGANLVNRTAGRYLAKRTQADLQFMGVPEGSAKRAGKVVQRFTNNISQGVIGFAPGTVALATKPRTMGEELGKFYTDFYEPLLKGDIEGFARNLEKDPDMALDWLGGVGAVAGGVRRMGVATRAARAARAGVVETGPVRAAVRGLVTGQEPADLAGVTWGRRVSTPTHVVRQGGQIIDTGVQRYRPGSALGGAISDAYNYAIPRITGGRARVRKGLREAQEARTALAHGQIQSFRALARDVQADPAQAKAFDRALIYGGDDAQVIADIRREIEIREQEGMNQSPAEIDELTRLGQAADVLANPSAGFRQAVDMGRSISRSTQSTLINAGLLNPITAERMLTMPRQFLEGPVPEITSSVRDEFITAMQGQDFEPEAIAAAIQYLDANAASYARRFGVAPAQFYDDLYRQVQAVEFADAYDALLNGHEETTLAQTSPTAIYTISEGKAAPHLKARAELLSDDPEVRARAEALARPKGRGTPVTTIEQKAQRILDQIPNREEALEFARWYKTMREQFTEIFGEDVDRALRSFLISQAGTSPEDGMMALLKMLEYRHVHGRWPTAGIWTDITKLVNAWENANMGEDPAGIAAKISDFFNSESGMETRTWLGKIEGPWTGPGVVDRWTVRSDGFVDRKAYSYLRSIGVDAPNPAPYEEVVRTYNVLARKRRAEGLTPDEQVRLERLQGEVRELARPLEDFYDMATGPNPYQYEYSSIRLNQLRDYFNDNQLYERGGWTVEEVQALDWFAIRREWGEPGGGWDSTWARNTFRIVGEVTGDKIKQWLGEGARGAIVREVTANGSHGRVEILGTPTQAVALAKRMTEETGRPAYAFYEYGVTRVKNFGAGRRPGFDVAGDPDLVLARMREKLGEIENTGALVLPWGDGRLRIMFVDPEGNLLPNARRLRDRYQQELRMEGVEVSPVDAVLEVHHASGGKRSLYRGEDARGVLARGSAAWRRRSDFPIASVRSESEAARFIEGLARNKRAWSLSPRAADDFTTGGYRGFLTEDGNAGAAISPDGEIVSVFNSGSFQGAGGYVLVEALANGGSWLNAYDGYLPAYYANAGFREIARVPFSEEFAPPGWTYAEGRPDLVFMAYAPDRPVGYGRHLDDFDAAVEATRRAGLAGLKRRPVEGFLAELADRGDGLPHQARDGQVLAQWQRKVNVEEGDPVLQGLVRITDDGVEMMITPAANFSTIVHENGHAVLRSAIEWLIQGNDPRLPALLRGLEIEDAQAPYSARSQELFASLVETRAYMGGIPAPQARRMAAETAGRMRQVYRDGIEQVGGEFAKEIEKLLSDNHISSILDNLVDVTYGVQRRSDAVFIPRVPPTASSRVWNTMQRLSRRPTRAAITPPRVSPVRKGARGILFERGEYRYGPEVVADYATTVVRHQTATELAAEIRNSPLARQIELNEFGAPVIPEGHVPFVYERVPEAVRELDRRMGMSEVEADIRAARAQPETAGADVFGTMDVEPQELAEQTVAATGQSLAEALPENLDAYERGSLPALLESRAIVAIPDWLARDYQHAVAGTHLFSSITRFVSADLGWLGRIVGTPVGILNGFARWSMIGKGGYITTNTVGSALTATAHNPFWVGEIRKSVDALSNWSVSTLHLLDELGGMGSLELARVLEEERGLGRFAQREREVYSKAMRVLSLPERRIRRATLVAELRRAGIRDEAHFLRVLDAIRGGDQRLERVLNQIVRSAEDGVIRFRGMNETEKFFVRRAFFVYGWLRAAFRYTARFPLEHPILAAVMNRIGNEGWDELQEMLEREIGFLGGPLVGKGIFQGPAGRMARMVDPTQVLPFGTGAEILRIITGLGASQDESLSDLFSPGVAFALSLAYGETPFGQSPFEQLKSYGPGKGFAGVPFLSWIMRTVDPKYTETKLYGPRSRTDVVLSFFLGQLWPRDMKLDVAQDLNLRRQPLSVSAPIRVQADLDKLLEAYQQAVKVTGGGESEEWLRSAQAHAAYDLTTRLKDKGWQDLDQEQRDLQRSVVRAKTLREYYPDAYARLIEQDYIDVDKKGEITALDPEIVDDEYSTWITESWSDMRSYIRDTLGDDALKK